MALEVWCTVRQHSGPRALEEAGALVFSPPDHGARAQEPTVAKLHACAECWRRFIAPLFVGGGAADTLEAKDG